MKSKPKRLPIDNGFVKTKLPQSEIVIDTELFRLETEMNNETKESKIESNNKRIEKLKEMLNPKNKQQRHEDYVQLFTKLGSRLPPGIAEHITSYIYPVVGDIILTNVITSIVVNGEVYKSGEVELYGLVIDTKEIGRLLQITFIYKDASEPDGYRISKSTNYESPHNIEKKTIDELNGFYKHYLHL